MPVPPLDGFRIPLSDVWQMSSPSDAGDVVYRNTLVGGNPMPSWHIRPWKTQRITIIKYELLRYDGAAHKYMMIGNNYVGDPKLWLDPLNNYSANAYPYGYGDTFPAIGESGGLDYIDVHGASAAAGAAMQWWLTFHYLVHDDVAIAKCPVFSAGFDQNDGESSSYQNYTVVQRIEPSAITVPSFTITQARAVWEPIKAAGLSVRTAYIGHGNSTAGDYNFVGSPVQLLFGGGAAGNMSNPGTLLCSDYTTGFVWNKTSPILVAYDINAASQNCFKVRTSHSGASAYWKNALEASSTSKSGYTTAASAVLGIARIDMDGFA